MRRPIGRRRQRGVALITAILLVALGTVLAAAIAYQNAMTARRVAATFAFDQALLYAQGAEALAAYALRQDSRDAGRVDHSAESWARPLGPIEIADGVVFEAALQDLQGRFNLNSLVTARGETDPAAVEIFQRLLELLELEPKWAQLIADWIDRDTDAQFPDGAEDNVYTGQDPPYRTANTLITSTSELLALPQFGRERYLRLAPFVVALPRDATLNVCAAPGPVLDALLTAGSREYSLDPARLAKSRESACFPTLDDFQRSFDSDRQAWERVKPRLSETSRYFRLTSVITIGTTEFALYSLLLREQAGGNQSLIRPLQRSFTAD